MRFKNSKWLPSQRASQSPTVLWASIFTKFTALERIALSYYSNQYLLLVFSFLSLILFSSIMNFSRIQANLSCILMVTKEELDSCSRRSFKHCMQSSYFSQSISFKESKFVSLICSTSSSTMLRSKGSHLSRSFMMFSSERIICFTLSGASKPLLLSFL